MKTVKLLVIATIVCLSLVSCSGKPPSSTATDKANTMNIGNTLAKNQPTPTDIKYTVERYLLQKRAYWINGERDKARALPCPIKDMPIGYVVLFSGGVVVERFTVDGKVVSLNSYLTPDSEYYEKALDQDSLTKTVDEQSNKWLPDVDGAYGYNDNGIFFFTPDGVYFEWGGEGRAYLYTDYPIKINNPLITINEGG